MCLEWRADNWTSQVTGADLVRSAYKLLSTECNPAQPADVPAVHELSPGQELRSSEHRFVCTPELMSMLASTSPEATRRLRTNTILHKTTSVGFVSRFEQGDSMQEILDLPKGLSTSGPLFTWRRDGHLFKSELFDLTTTIASLDELASVVQAAGFSDHLHLFQEPGDRLVFLVGGQPESLQVFSMSIDERSTWQEYSVLLPEKFLQRLPPKQERLREIRVGIVGLGSLGSKIAASLGRSGIRRFLLIDDDLLMPGNVCRHELSWEAVGMHKADAVREALNLIAPTMEIDVRLHRVAGQESAMTAATALKDLTSCNLLIDATANPEVFLRLAAVAKLSRSPMCWGEVFAGGFGGLIARARPDIDPHPAAVRAAILNHLGTLPPAPHQRAENYDIAGTEPVIAHDGEVSQIAATLTQFALDLVLGTNPMCSRIPRTSLAYEKSGYFPNRLIRIRLQLLAKDGIQLPICLLATKTVLRPLRFCCRSRMRASMLTLILQSNVTQTLEAALEKAGRREVGGVLMAEHVGVNEFTITDLTVHKRGALASFVRRIEEALSSLVSFFARTHHDYARFNYIGEWHSHPCFELEPSPKDDASMIEIVLDPKVGAKFAVLLLVKLDLDSRLQANGHLYLPDSTRHRCNLTYASSINKQRN